MTQETGRERSSGPLIAARTLAVTATLAAAASLVAGLGTYLFVRFGRRGNTPQEPGGERAAAERKQGRG